MPASPVPVPKAVIVVPESRLVPEIVEIVCPIAM